MAYEIDRHEKLYNLKCLLCVVCLPFLILLATSDAQAAPRVVDIPTRPGVTQRMLVVSPDHPRAALILFPGGHGGLQISPAGELKWGEMNFLVRTKDLFASRGFVTIVLDAPSDRQDAPYLSGFRQTSEHLADIKAVIAWAHQQFKVPVWLVGTSRGTQSAAFIATKLTGANSGLNGLILTSTILNDKKSRPVPKLDINQVTVPVLVVHHRQDACKHCPYDEIPLVMDNLRASPKKQLITIDGGQSRGDPCESFAYHGFNGNDKEVVEKISQWILEK